MAGSAVSFVCPPGRLLWEISTKSVVVWGNRDEAAWHAEIPSLDPN